jgi:hypothetical protein
LKYCPNNDICLSFGFSQFLNMINENICFIKYIFKFHLLYYINQACNLYLTLITHVSYLSLTLKLSEKGYSLLRGEFINMKREFRGDWYMLNDNLCLKETMIIPPPHNSSQPLLQKNPDQLVCSMNSLVFAQDKAKGRFWTKARQWIYFTQQLTTITQIR